MGSTELKQLLKLPVLIQHYLEHQKINHHITILDYLKEHYHDDIRSHADYKRDMELPFKSLELNQSVIYVLIPSPNIDFSMSTPFVYKTKMVIADSDHHSNGIVDCIWQPPRQA